ncbi:MAG: fibronectin type III domain-containing protein [Candidatus Nanopelagicales bacterium]|nr:fibronectin type III domain-containing protein [Candidatus Nanopelagicales bacterium]
MLLVSLGLLLSMAGTVVARPNPAQSPRPKAPSNHKVVNHADFRWTPVRGATSYQLQIAQDRRFTNVVKTIETPATRFIDTKTWPAASYWWRVRTIAPFTSGWSKERVFTRRWLVPDAGSGRQEVARVDNVTVEDFGPEQGLQVPYNAITIRWEPVADASYYVVQFDKLERYDPDLIPPFGFEPDAICITPHTVLTPNAEPVSLPLQGVALIEDARSLGCDLEEGGAYWMRIRAVDVLSDGSTELYSLWSDEARSEAHPQPNPIMFEVQGKVVGTDAQLPATLTGPSDGKMFVDAPLLKWNAVNWADSYKVVLSVDRDFTTEVGHYYTTNTRLIPLERIPEDNARSYFWYVVPCRFVDSGESDSGESDGSEPGCVSSNRVVNRSGTYRSFKKYSAQPRTQSANKSLRPWTRFPWKPFSETATRSNKKLGDRTGSVGGIDHYEFQVRTKNGDWPETVTSTDLPQILPLGLDFGQRYKWRIRVVDGSGQARPWSNERSVRTPIAVSANPVALKAFRSPTRVTLLWRTPKSRFFPVTDYSVYYSTKGKRWKPLTKVKNNRAAFRVRKGTRYWFMVTANNAAGESPPSKVFVRR